MKKVIVVGANGFLGRELCKKLASKGIAVVALVAKGGDTLLQKACIMSTVSNLIYRGLLIGMELRR